MISRRKRRVIPLSKNIPTPKPKIIFNCEEQNEPICRICNFTGQMINPCECQLKYHHMCLLRYVRGLIKQKIKTHQLLDLSSICCEVCQYHFHVIYSYNRFYDCSKFKNRASSRCFGGQFAIISMVVVVLIISIAIFFRLQNTIQQNHSKSLFYGLLAVLLLQGLVLMALIAHFFHKSLIVQQIVLQKINEHIDGLLSSNSDQTRLSNQCEVIIRE